MHAIYKREVRAYLFGVTGAVFVAFLLLMLGIFSTAVNFSSGYPAFEVALSSVLLVLLLVVPIITMRSFSEDRHAKTDQLLYSLPLPLSRIVLAKFFAMATVLAVPCLAACLYPLILSFYGEINYAAAYGAILGFFLLGCALIAIGMFLSSLTESQVIAALLTFGAFFLLYLINGIAGLIPATAAASLVAYLVCAAALGGILYALTKNAVAAAAVGGAAALAVLAAYLIRSAAFAGSIQKVLGALAIFDRFSNFSNGIVDLTAYVYYASIAALFIVFTVQSMEKKRWA